jgi:hypothetical protein
VTPRLWHSCGRYSADALFSRSKPHVRRVFDRLADAARSCGPVRIYAQKTRMVIQARIRFAGGQPRKEYFQAGFLVPPDFRSDRVFKRETVASRHYVVAYVRLARESDVDGEIRRLMRAAYRIGCQIRPRA